ncbi:hypothetical protein M5D96_000551 [Drosophila gunungcola]|uniref:Uncharacterized protein n=1 Tax=Drosophila gunungcola TaxID=103775 RepID=A0A9P9YX40_9MUSC|nr:hypothetical protein M5D96_000551 [Drosophila gunungcola]
MPIASTTLGDDTFVQLYAASRFRRWLAAPDPGPGTILRTGDVYWVYAMSFIGPSCGLGNGYWGSPGPFEKYGMSGRTTWPYRMRQ